MFSFVLLLMSLRLVCLFVLLCVCFACVVYNVCVCEWANVFFGHTVVHDVSFGCVVYVRRDSCLLVCVVELVYLLASVCLNLCFIYVCVCVCVCVC